MIAITDNSPKQVNAALIAMKDEIRNDNQTIIKKNVKTAIAEMIDDNVTSQTKTWSSDKINKENTYPEGFIYLQMYNPTTGTWEADPDDLGMQPEAGCTWADITANFASYPYMKIGSGTTQSGHNAYHRHEGGSLKIGGFIGDVLANGGGPAPRFSIFGSNAWTNYQVAGGADGYVNNWNYNGYWRVQHNGTNWSGYTTYNGNSSETTNEVNASNVIVWKVKST